MRIPPPVQALLWMAAARECLCAQEHLTLAVWNYAKVSRTEMAGAIRTARWAYRAAGIETDWPVCNVPAGDSSDCSEPLPADGRYLELAVMRRRAKTLDAFWKGSNPAGLALAGVEFPRPRAYVFYSTTNYAALLTVRPSDVVLGCVLVHESAHLLGLRHESRGVMRPWIDAHNIDDVLAGRPFSPAEVRSLRAAVVRRQQDARLVASRK